MATSLFLLFNHQLTQDQKNDVSDSLGAEQIVEMPSELGKIWGQIPPDMPKLDDHLKAIKDWLGSEAVKGDYALIQGDFGACYAMVNFAFGKGLIPVYATTKRETVEETMADGSVTVTRQFRHQIFRKYGK